MTAETLEQPAASRPSVSHDNEINAAAAVAREESEIAGAMRQARECPRSEARAYRSILDACGRAGFADNAVYNFPRSNKKISGPSIHLAREMARCWGNMRYGLRYVREDDDRVMIKGSAHDLERNVYVEVEDAFAKKIQRQIKDSDGKTVYGSDRKPKTEWVSPDERDLRELVNRRGAICVRNAILQLIPPDFVDDALTACRKTMSDPNKLPSDRRSAMHKVVTGFDALAVTPDMIEKYLGHDLEAMSDEEIADLRGIYASIRDGHTRREEHFAVPSRSNAGSIGDGTKPGPDPAKPPSDLSPEQEKARTELRSRIARFGELKRGVDGPMGFEPHDEAAWLMRAEARLAEAGVKLDDVLEEIDAKIADLETAINPPEPAR